MKSHVQTKLNKMSSLCYATATVLGKHEARIAAGRDALALAGDWVEEVSLVARSLDTFSAAAAVLVPGLAKCASDGLGAVAQALAGVEVPGVVFWANLEQAAALTELGVPVMAITQASLRRTFPEASVRVKDVVWMLFPRAVFEMRRALALAIVEVEVVVFVASGCGFGASAAASVPVEECVASARIPCCFADADACGVVVNKVLIARANAVHALATGVVPCVAWWAEALVATAAANCEAIVEVETDRARLCIAEALSTLIVPELPTFAV